MPTDYGILMKNGENYSHDTAESISYDNTNSGLSSTDVQAAIDELNGKKVPSGGTNQTYLKGDGTWGTPINTTYAIMTSSIPGLVAGSHNTGYLQGDMGWYWSDPIDTTYGLVSPNGPGLVPQLTGDTDKYLKADGTWVKPSNTTYAVMTSGTSGLAPQATSNAKYLRGDATWQDPSDTTYAIATTANNGLVRKLTGATTKYFRCDGSWEIPVDHTYGTVTTALNGLVPSGGVSGKYLRADGEWVTPANHTYGIVTENKEGLIPAGGTSAKYLKGASSTNPATWASPPTSPNENVTQTYVTTGNTGLHYVLMAATANDTDQKDTAVKGPIRYSPVDGDLYMINNKVRFRNDQFYVDSGVLVVNNTAAQQLYIAGSNETDYRVFVGVRQNAWTFCPDVSQKLRLGTSSYRWSTVYAIDGTINTSDRNKKKDIVELNDFAKEFIMDLKPVSYKFRNDEPGINHDRTHYGLIAQDVEETMTKFGLTALDFAGFCRDQKMEEYYDETADPIYNPDGTTVNDENGHPVKPKLQRPVEGEYIYGLRYEEFISPMIKTIQLQEEGIATRKAKIAELKSRLDRLENK